MTSSKGSKSFRQWNSVAPYRDPVVKVTNRKPSFLSKMRTLFKSGHGEGEEHSSVKRRSGLSQGDENVAQVPGGFFEVDQRSLDEFKSNSRVSSRGAGMSMTEDGSRVSRTADDTQLRQEQGDESEANVSNAKLANFFAEKGDVPLTDIELEGVMSLLQKSKKFESRNSSFANATAPVISKDDHYTPDRLFKNNRVLSTSSTMANSSFKVPTFTPKYENQTGGSRNYSLRSISSAAGSDASNTSARRVFDYSGMPSPYRAVVLKYNSATKKCPRNKDVRRRSMSQLEHGSVKTSKQNNSVTKMARQKPEKKLSNVASALVTLLDNNDNNANTTVTTNTTTTRTQNGTSQLANPYSSYAHKHKPLPPLLDDKPSEQPQKTGLSLPPPPPIKENVDTIDVKAPPPGPITSSDLAERPTGSTDTKQDTASALEQERVKLHQPVRSSSLRSNVVVAPTPATEPVTKKTQQVKPVAKSVAPSTPAFSFGFGKSEATTPFKPLPMAAPVEDTKKPAVAALPLAELKKPEPTMSKSAERISPAEQEEYTFDFDTPSSSNVDVSGIDDTEVDKYKSMFVF
ncbi:FG-nucleoporin NUP60 KNAG_0B05520 [Huiozyma naganishii CBS 8797]|uniref:Nucleoporin NUP60 n=1 Tax=Huiozyma naganishii (strain ATCC MYA-139 / BCRC 22969 / CBS 8797 / KCTC 17520 / NBRC 10181 / NCYC 3082 / Yp74L-3) TaxID=1071383 RepID=J7R2F7_HUIN7|nr:hypothetical protein KNAG_0B05520 [Kazachstania naganishii CBS 8797]CCK68985.1 hypothetical protein KNAG_0B05520 [Kazachstania naganishii CBS 8797]